MKNIEVKLAKTVVLLFCWAMFLTTGYSQSVQIVYNGPNNCIAPGANVNLSSNVTGLGQNGYLQCLKWTSSNPNEVINQDWLPAITVTPQITTSYTLCIMQGASPVVCDTITLKTSKLEDFDLPCAIDDGGIVKIKDIKGIHKNTECLNGVVYSPSEISLNVGEGKRTFIVTAKQGNVTLKDTVVLINSNFPISGFQLYATKKGKFTLVVTTPGGNQARQVTDFSKLTDYANMLENLIGKFPVVPKTSYNFLGKLAGGESYKLCEGKTPCYGKKSKASIGIHADASAKVEFHTPTVIAGLYVILTGKVRIGVDGD